MKLSIIKIYSLIFTILLGCSSTSQSTPKNDLEKSNLQGNVKTISEVTYDLSKGDIKVLKGQKGQSGIDSKTTYNIDGYIIESMRERDGSPYSITRYFYNDQFKIISKEEFYRTGYQSSPNNGKGNEIDMTSPFSVSNFKYDDRGLKIEGKVFSDNELYSVAKYKYDNEGGQIEEAYYKDENLIWKTKHQNEYDSYGNLKENILLRSDDKISLMWKYEYDDLGRRVKSQLLNGNSDIRNTYIKEYDTQGNVIKEVKSEGSSENIIYSYIFNYEYDVNLNWTKKTRFSNGKASKIIERQIVYYD